MPRGSKGKRRPADVIGIAVHVMRIVTGQIEDNPTPVHARKGGLMHQFTRLTNAFSWKFENHMHMVAIRSGMTARSEIKSLRGLPPAIISFAN